MAELSYKPHPLLPEERRMFEWREAVGRAVGALCSVYRQSQVGRTEH